MPLLVSPTRSVHRSFIEALREYQLENRYVNLDAVTLSGPAEFGAYVDEVVSWSGAAALLRPGWVPETELWFVEGEGFIGRLTIRHRLTAALRHVGGHIGYDVRPSARRQGNATEMLKQGLPFAAALGIDPALLTCDRSNLASRRTIEKNGGTLDSETPEKLRFWVPTRPAYSAVSSGMSPS